MAIMINRALRFSLYLIVGLFAYGVLLIFLYGGLDMLITWKIPDFSRFTWWQIVLAPVIVGVVALFAEVAFLPVEKHVIEPDRVSDPLWKRGLKALFLIALMSVLLFGLIIVQEMGWF